MSDYEIHTMITSKNAAIADALIEADYDAVEFLMKSATAIFIYILFMAVV